MRMSQMLSQTLREAPAEADIASHILLLRAGFIRQLAAGVFTYMPLALRAIQKIEQIIRDEMGAIGGQELSMPVVHPAEIWKETGRWFQVDSVMTRFRDRNERDMVLAMTHEEVVGDLIRKEIRSYRQLPVLLYQIQTKWRDEPRPRAGLIRTREFIMKDSYSLDTDEAGLDKQYRAHYQAYFNIYSRCALPVIAVASDTGMMGGKLAHEFMYLNAIGEDTLLINEETGYAANREVARIYKAPAATEVPLKLEKIATPDTATIEALAEFLSVPKARTAKAVFMMAVMNDGETESERFVFAVVRGDMDLNETKLANVVKARSLRPATEAEIRAIGAEPGYGSPMGVKNCLIVVDEAITSSPNLVAGANEAGFHLKNVNYGRDFMANVVADIVSARDGDLEPEGKGRLKAVRGVEVGNIFKLGTRYSAAMGATFLDSEGQSQPIIMGSYGIGVGRLLACIAEEYHDENGLVWPVSVAPYQVHLVSLPGDEAQEVAEKLYADLRAKGVEVLFDDRDERAGVKFNDADLIGLPVRVTVSPRSLQNGGVEVKRRDQDERSIVAVEDMIVHVAAVLDALKNDIAKRVVAVPYKA